MSKILGYFQIKKLTKKKSWINLDKVCIENEKHVIGLKNVSITEAFFEGHFPNQKVMPGILQLELMLEASSILNLSYSDFCQYDLASVKRMRFKKPIFPGSQVIFKLEKQWEKDGISSFIGKTFVKNQICSIAEFTIVKIDISSLTSKAFEQNIAYNNNEEDKVSLSVEETYKDIPHRHPFLFVEKILYFNEKEIVAEKCITNNDVYMTVIDEGYSYIPGSYLLR